MLSWSNDALIERIRSSATGSTTRVLLSATDGERDTAGDQGATPEQTIFCKLMAFFFTFLVKPTKLGRIVSSLLDSLNQGID
mgnify:CR=1 FL=1